MSLNGKSNNKADKNKKAVAIKYDPAEAAPKVLASGKGYVAEKIIETAKAEKLPVVQDSALVEDLEKINIGEFIPPELYQAVAQILVFITDLDKESLKKYGNKRY